MAQYYLETPIREEEIRRLKVGDILYVSGTMFTARDEAHHRALEYRKQGIKLPIDFRGLVLYHCGPIVKRENETWKIVAAGPTTSMRMEKLEDRIHKRVRYTGRRREGWHGSEDYKGHE